jgi:hypothetical protein
MTKKRFCVIDQNLIFTDVPPLNFIDKFWQVRQMICAWSKNMAQTFVAAWIVCLDMSMSIWHSKWTCPGWVFCPRKPHPFGNEYHSACCGISTILFVIEMVEGKNAPDLLCRPYKAMGKTAGLLLRMLSSYFGTGRYIVLDSGFCVLKAIVEAKWFVWVCIDKKEDSGRWVYRERRWMNSCWTTECRWGIAMLFWEHWTVSHITYGP